MTDLERMVQLFRAGHKIVTDDVQDLIGELDAEQTAQLTGLICGFVMADHDFHNPRPDGRKWIDIFHEMMGPAIGAKRGEEEKKRGGGGQGVYRG